MNYLAQWSFDPFVVVCAGIVLLHERGLARLARRSRPERTRARRRRALVFYAGLALLLLTVTSPIHYWAGDYFFVHMIEHILIMFFAPILIVAGAPWLPLVHALPVGLRRSAGRALLLSGWAAPLRALGRLFTNGVVAVALYNLVMCVWHLPIAFDAAETDQAIHIWLMHGSFLVSGVLFWLQVIPSYPIRPRLGWPGRIAAIFVTDCVMFVLAMALSILTAHSWYPVYDHLPGVTLSLPSPTSSSARPSSGSAVTSGRSRRSSGPSAGRSRSRARRARCSSTSSGARLASPSARLRVRDRRRVAVRSSGASPPASACPRAVRRDAVD